MKKYTPRILGALLNRLTPIAPKPIRNAAFELLSKVNTVPVTEEGIAFFKKGRTHWLNVDGIKTALHQWGKGPVKILFLHGWMSNSQRWEGYVEALDPDIYSCYALDAPAHGLSAGKKLNLELFREAVERALEITGEVDTIVSHSFGNMAVYYHFLYRGELPIKKYVILGTPTGMDAILYYFRTTFGISTSMLNNLLVKINEVLKIPHSEISVAEFLKQVNKPVLLIHEESDAITPIEPIRFAVSGIDRIETMYTTGLSHTLKHPEVIDRVTAFIKQPLNSLKICT